jgi:hypothetical protein
MDEWGDEGSFTAPEQVLSELQKRDDELHAWARDRRHLFKPADEAVQAELTGILALYPRLIDPNAVDEDADPFVIALAKATSATVVSSESPKQNALKIPNLCSYLGIECLKLLAFFRDVGLEL